MIRGPAETAIAAREKDRGRAATFPADIPQRGWKDIILRTKDEIGEDRLSLITAGCAYYLLLALFPGPAALVSIYGLVASPSDVAEHVADLATVVPSAGLNIITDQLETLATQRTATLSFGLVFGLLFSLWNANNGFTTLFAAMNIAYGEREKRGFFRLTLVTLAFTIGGVLLLVLSVPILGFVPALLDRVGLGSMTEALISFVRWPLLFLLAATAFAMLYRYGPSREGAKAMDHLGQRRRCPCLDRRVFPFPLVPRQLCRL